MGRAFWIELRAKYPPGNPKHAKTGAQRNASIAAYRPRVPNRLRMKTLTLSGRIGGPVSSWAADSPPSEPLAARNREKTVKVSAGRHAKAGNLASIVDRRRPQEKQRRAGARDCSGSLDCRPYAR